MAWLLIQACSHTSVSPSVNKPLFPTAGLHDSQLYLLKLYLYSYTGYTIAIHHNKLNTHNSQVPAKIISIQLYQLYRLYQLCHIHYNKLNTHIPAKIIPYTAVPTIPIVSYLYTKTNETPIIASYSSTC